MSKKNAIQYKVYMKTVLKCQSLMHALKAHSLAKKLASPVLRKVINRAPVSTVSSQTYQPVTMINYN